MLLHTCDSEDEVNEWQVGKRFYSQCRGGDDIRSNYGKAHIQQRKCFETFCPGMVSIYGT